MGIGAAELGVRPYRADDAVALLEIFRGAVLRVARRDYSEAQVHAWAPDDMDPDAWAAKRASRPTWVAEIDGQPVGFIDLEADGHIDMLFVSADHQGCGIASALWRVLEAAARSRSLDRLYTEASLTARPFFENMGFTVQAQQEVAKRGQSLINFRMEKRLG